MGQHHHHDASSQRLGLVFFLNLGFTVVEFIGGLLTNSTAILADAVHDLGDSLSIGSAWVLHRLGRRDASDAFTYGFRRLSLFGALVNGLVLLAGSVWVLREAIPRLFDPVMPVTEGMLLLALLGVTVNGYAAWRLTAGKTLNERMLNWHLLEDVLGWLAVLVAAIIMQFVDWPILDPLLSVGFTLFILVNVVRNLWQTARLFFQAVPDAELRTGVERALLSVDGVSSLHHLHLWSLDGEHHVLTAHVVARDPLDHARLKARIADALATFELAHTTIEVESEAEYCRDAGLR
ncbi:MAG: cation transporter [Haliea sp.]|nr:cation transporter [Haliea sp.]|tara:strand:+ start:225684 stop:226559 length:876 start_codon:yes stop_codon:yes gene_type:complete